MGAGRWTRVQAGRKNDGAGGGGRCTCSPYFKGANNITVGHAQFNAAGPPRVRGWLATPYSPLWRGAAVGMWVIGCKAGALGGRRDRYRTHKKVEVQL